MDQKLKKKTELARITKEFQFKQVDEKKIIYESD